jgi:hypothetical protein
MTNRLSTLVDSYRLATKRPPQAGRILVHNHVRSGPGGNDRGRGFPAWWAKPGKEFTRCACGWRPDLGSITRCNGPALPSGGGDTTMRGQQGVAVEHHAIEMVVQSWLRVEGLPRRRPSRRGTGVDRALDSECKNR